MVPPVGTAPYYTVMNNYPPGYPQSHDKQQQLQTYAAMSETTANVYARDHSISHAACAALDIVEYAGKRAVHY